MSDSGYPTWPDLFRWLNGLKDRVETLPSISAEQVITGEFDPDLIPPVPWDRVLKVGSSLGDLETRSAGDLSSGTLLAARMPALTGDVSTVVGTVDTTLATVNTSPGTYGSGTAIPLITVNGKGLVTLVMEQPIQTGALTRVNDTNVTATLGGTPLTALLKDVSITLGWTGTLGLVRGGTAADLSATGGASQFLRQNSVGAPITVVRPAVSDLSDGSHVIVDTSSYANPAWITSLAGSKLTGAYTAAGLTMATARLMGRTTAGNAAAEEISVAGSLSLSAGVLTGTAAGTVTAVSVATANGFAGTSSGGATPALTLSTTITGIVKGDGTGLSAATVTGLGDVVLATSPTLTTAALGSSTATTQTPQDNSTKIATTAYVDTAVLGQNFKEACKYGTTAALPAIVYNNGSSGSGATLTAAGFGALTFDGSTPSVGDRILVKNQVSTFQNGIYTVTVVGGVATLFVLTRTTDMNQATEIATGDSLFIVSGSTLSATTWAINSADHPVIGTDAITFAQVAGQGAFTAGNGITISGVSIAIDTSVTVDKTSVQTLTNKTLASPTIAKIANLTTNGYAKTSAGDGTLGIQTTVPASDVSSGAALTKNDDTNVTATLGGSPTVALIAATSITLGWTGTLAPARGGIGFDASGIAKGGMLSGTGSGTFGLTGVGTDGQVWTADAASSGGAKWAAGGSGSGISSAVAGARVALGF